METYYENNNYKVVIGKDVYQVINNKTSIKEHEGEELMEALEYAYLGDKKIEGFNELLAEEMKGDEKSH